MESRASQEILVEDGVRAFRVCGPSDVDFRRQDPIVSNNMSDNESLVTINLVKWDTMLTNAAIYEQNALQEATNLKKVT